MPIMEKPRMEEGGVEGREEERKAKRDGPTTEPSAARSHHMDSRDKLLDMEILCGVSVPQPVQDPLTQMTTVGS